MGLPTSSLAIAVFVVVALPGFIQAGVRRWARGETASDRELGLSIARGAAFAVALTAVYLMIWGERLVAGISAGDDADALKITDPRHVGTTVLVLYLMVPVALSVLLQWQHVRWEKSETVGWFRAPRSKYGYTLTPTAWDHAVRDVQPAWIRVRRANGEWVGGWFTKGSQASTYPEPRSLYIAQQFEIDQDGQLGDAVPSTGVYITINDDDLVFWGRPQAQPYESASEEGQ
ncbi:DUF6338 family protein [Demequina sp. NBRC 110057]|uniref:DUF6338 family protein n=1 Tax=Demequina sp. NBRC 110057 TaxID=1570346 RepID=UPI0011777EA5|nr:DUF6338 family protein [Demequina sp. NBRC 110057]